MVENNTAVGLVVFRCSYGPLTQFETTTVSQDLIKMVDAKSYSIMKLILSINNILFMFAQHKLANLLLLGSLLPETGSCVEWHSQYISLFVNFGN